MENRRAGRKQRRKAAGKEERNGKETEMRTERQKATKKHGRQIREEMAKE